MNSMSYTQSTIEYLRYPRSRWVDIQVNVSHIASDGTIKVESKHTSYTGQVLQRFSTVWDIPDRLDTEYGFGLSLIHDLKDHIFYGLGFTPLTEIQTIVQTYYGREVSGGTFDKAPDNDYMSVIQEHVFHELFGLQGRPLVYDPKLQKGLLDVYAPQADESEREEAFFHLCEICENIMLPLLKDAYLQHEPLRLLQASTRDQLELVDEFLEGIQWADRSNLLLRLSDNQGFRTQVRAYINEELADISRQICEQTKKYTDEYNLVERFARIFSTIDYLI